MTALAPAQSSMDTLLSAVAADVERLLAELGQLPDDAAWRRRVQARCQALGAQLQRAQETLADRRQQAREALSGLMEALTWARTEAPASNAAAPGGEAPAEMDSGLAGFRRALTDRYDALRVALEARRIVEPEWVARSANRHPKLTRAVFHVLMGIACAALYQFVVSRQVALWLLGGFVTFFGSVEVVRRFSARVNDFWVDKVFGAVARPQERYHINSATWYMLGLAVITLIAPKPVVIAAILILAFGDPVASAVGHRWGGYRFGNGKSVIGLCAFVAAAAGAAGLYLGTLSGMPQATWITLGAAMVATGAATELLAGRLDDNFAIPVASSLAGMLVLFNAG